MTHDAPIVQKICDLYQIFYQHVDHFPKKSRGVLGQRIEQLILELLELTSRASFANQQDKLTLLSGASSTLDILKILFRLTYQLKIVDQKKYIGLETELQESG